MLKEHNYVERTSPGVHSVHSPECGIAVTSLNRLENRFRSVDQLMYKFLIDNVQIESILLLL